MKREIASLRTDIVTEGATTVAALAVGAERFPIAAVHSGALHASDEVRMAFEALIVSAVAALVREASGDDGASVVSVARVPAAAKAR